MDSFNQDLVIPRSEENINMNSNHDDHDDSVMQNVAVKQDGAYQPSEHGDKDSRAESCGFSQPAQPDESWKGRTSDIIIVHNGDIYSNAPSISSTTQQEPTANDKLLENLIRMNLSLCAIYGSKFGILKASSEAEEWFNSDKAQPPR